MNTTRKVPSTSTTKSTLPPSPKAMKAAPLPARGQARSITTLPQTSDDEITTSRIRERAFVIYLARKRKGGAGDAASDWAQAEREVKGTDANRSISSEIDVKSQARDEVLLASGK